MLRSNAAPRTSLLLSFIVLGATCAQAADGPIGLLPAPAAVAAKAVTPAAEANHACLMNLGMFLKEIDERQARMAARFSLETHKDGPLRTVARSVRDSMRRRLQIWNGHPYPVLAIDDAPFALGWAKNAVGKLDADSSKLINVDQIWKELNEQLTGIRDFQKDIAELSDKSVNNAILIKSLEAKLAEKNLPPFGVEIEVPVLGHDAAGIETQTTRKVYYGTLTQMELELKTFKATDRALGKTANERALSQAIDVKRLETYRHELLRQKLDNPNTQLPKEYQDFLDAVTSLYTDETGKAVKPEFSPPYWAWQKLKWQQLTEETKSLYQREIPRFKEQKRIQEAIDYVKTLTPDEIRALGLQNVATTVERYKNYRWVRLGGVAAGLIGIPGAGHFGLKEIMYYFNRDSIEKEKCAGLEAEDAYLDCATQYLKTKFPGRFFVKVDDLEHILDESGDIKDEDIRAELDDIRDRRDEFLYGKNVQDAITGPAKTRLALSDPSSSDFRKALVSIRDEAAFKASLMNPDRKKGYLMFKYSVAFSKPNIKQLVDTVIDAKAEDQQRVLLNSMRNSYPIAAELANDLEGILKDHRQFEFDSAEEDRVGKELNINLDKLLNRGTKIGGLEAGKHLDMINSNGNNEPAVTPPTDVPAPSTDESTPVVDPSVTPATDALQPSTQPAVDNNSEIPDPIEKE